MSFLDDLKKEAERVEQCDQSAVFESELQRNLVIQSVRPHLSKLYNYLKETTGLLNVANPDVHVSYDIRGFGRLGPLRQSNYKVTAEDPNNLDKFVLSFECSRPDQVTFEIKGMQTAAALKEWLWGCNLRFTSKQSVDGDGVFVMDAFVPVTFEFSLDLDSAKVVLRISNLDTLGQNRSTYDPEVLDDEFMDELGKCIIGKEHRFHDISGNTMTQAARMALRQQIDQDKLRREIEVSSEGAPMPAKKKKKKKGILRLLFGG
jgi:hypothetical protein